ncbi:MAG: putative permease [Firmicutes bacterium]|nr:putative permease [Bacillota bacterium]
MDLNKNNIKKILGIATFVILLYVGLQHLNIVIGALAFCFNLIFPFLLGAAIAFVINVPMRAIENRLFAKGKRNGATMMKLKRPISLMITLVIVIGIIMMVSLLVVPNIFSTIVSLGDYLPDFFSRMEGDYLRLVYRFPILKDYLNIDNLNWQSFFRNLYNFILNSGADMVRSTFNVAGSIFGGVIDFFLGFIFSIYILAQKEKLGQQVRKLLYAYLSEKAADRVVSIATLAEGTFSRFLSGQCLEAVILGLLFFIVMTIFRIPYALIISITISFTALIPIFGAFIGCLIGALLILIVNPITALVFIVIFIVLQQIEGNFIYPHVVGGSVGLPSMWVLVAVTIGGSTFGIAGMLIFIPMTSVLYTLLRSAMYRRLKLRDVSSAKYN